MPSVGCAPPPVALRSAEAFAVRRGICYNFKDLMVFVGDCSGRTSGA
jgi:hypothetical protein